MDNILTNNNNDAFFEFSTYEEFRKERLELNHDNTLRLWLSLPSGLPAIDNKLVRRQTPKQQRARVRNMKFFAFYCTLFKKTFLRKKIHSKGKSKITNQINVISGSDSSL
jgi:hypothetical protein